ncbi:MAG: hypothetical protein NTX52_02270 [Planctomycetota bacterium]|nr:hypothetical protein [Planctomycetota bacterium]
MATQREKIVKEALEILKSLPNGIRYSVLVRKLKDIIPEIPENTIQGTIWDLDKKVKDVAKPERGIFILIQYLSQEKQAEALQKQISSKPAQERTKEI